ncbi:MAG: hypothetical protein DRP10_03170 [Candidatus Aenigmatarchaeota archaeon]|nr:MAG: hypothetical protein DRP10_03170 [Candidatus Aenigmarchaeota archaeon]
METALEIRRKRRKKPKLIKVNPFLLDKIQNQLSNINKNYKKRIVSFSSYVEHLMLNDYKNNFEILKKRKKSLF